MCLDLGIIGLHLVTRGQQDEMVDGIGREYSLRVAEYLFSPNRFQVGQQFEFQDRRQR